MSLNTDISTALHLLEHIHACLGVTEFNETKSHDDLKPLMSLLEDPVFRSIVTIQDSLAELNCQLCQHPSILPGDFDISPSGQLELSVPNTPVQPTGQTMYQDLYQDSSELDDQRVPIAPLVHSSSEDTSAQVTSPSLASEVIGMPPITNPTYAKEFQKVIEAAAKGRQICTVQLYKSEGTSLGFSVVGLRNKDRGELGIFLQEIQPNGIAGTDGRLLEGDQILAIDGQPLDSNISHEQAISILQKARGLVELIVARSAQDLGSTAPTDELSGASSSTAAAGGAATVIAQNYSDKEQTISASSTGTGASKSSLPSNTLAPAATSASTAPSTLPGGFVIERSPSAVSDASKSVSDMVLNTEWAQVEVINLINDGSGLGFGIIGGKSTGVVVKTILPGGVADRDNRLQSGDHILQIGKVNLRGMGSEQVAAVLRQSGTHVRLVVARPVEPTSPDYQALGSHAPIVPTKILGDPEELEKRLKQSVPETYNIHHMQPDSKYDNGVYTQESDIDAHTRPSLIMDVVRNPMPISATPILSSQGTVPIPADLPVLTMDPIDVNALPEMERFTVELKKDIYGLGITIAGYVCEKEELSGIFVKSISEGSAADLSNKIQINDRIVEVNGHSLQGYSNHEAVEVLRNTGQTVVLCLERYLRGPKYEQLQQAIAASELRLPQPSGSPSIASLPTFPISADGDTTTEIEPEAESHTTVDSAVLQEVEREHMMVNLEDANIEALLSDPSTPLTPRIEAAIKNKWQKIVGPDIEIVVAQLKKFAEGSGLGISLEGTVDVENGQEVRPHHYIRSILPEGPVGQNSTLRSGDELLEVNGYRLLGINHMEVVSVLKELPIHVRMICGRNSASAQDPLCPIDTAQHQAAFQTRSILGGSLQNLLPSMDRLVKAKSDGSLASTTTTATVTDASLNKMRSRSLEPLTGLARWSSEPQIIELVKGERGLGFSILDYQDPMNPNETVIVIRSLVPGGVAQVDGQLIPGDRLLFVNDIALENASLDQAVQALKGAPKGTVRIGVAKPLPIPDSIAQRLTPICMIRRSRSFPNESDALERAAELEDILSSRSGLIPVSPLMMYEDSSTPQPLTPVSGKRSHESGEEKPTKDDKRSKKKLKPEVAETSQDNAVFGFEETIMRVKKSREKDSEESYEPIPSLIKLTPLEKEKRALISDHSDETIEPEVVKEVVPGHPASTDDDDDDSAKFVQSFGSPLKVPCDEETSPEPVAPYLESAPSRDGLKLDLREEKKKVRIQEEQEEIILSDQDEFFREADQAQLVRARMTTAEQLVEEKSRKEEEAKAKAETSAKLHLPVLLKSTSESKLMPVVAEEKISEKNIKPEILMDLSQVSPSGLRDLEEELLDSPLGQPTKRKLSRVCSDSTRLLTERDYQLEERVAAVPAPPVEQEKVETSDKSTSSSLTSLPQVSRVQFSIGDSNIPATSGSEVSEMEKPRRRRRKSLEDSSSSGQYRHLRRTQSANKIVPGEKVQDARTHSAFSSKQRYQDKDRDKQLSHTDRHYHHHHHHYHYVSKVPPGKEDKRHHKSHPSRRSSGVLDSTEDKSEESQRTKSSYAERGVQGEVFDSPRREVETQTQGEHKGTQYSVKDLPEETPSKGSKKVGFTDEPYRFGSPKKEVEVQTEQECKAVQCEKSLLEELPVSVGSPRKEAQVQTCQENKSTQCVRQQVSAECVASVSSVPEITVSESKVPVIFVVPGKEDMTVTHRDKDGNLVWAKHWGPERRVEIHREPRTSLGLSIVGGKIDLPDPHDSQSQNVSGIFIKNVLPNSPAGRTGELKTGDRIIEVDGIDLRNSTHERAVEAIQAAGSPVCLLVQSLVHLSPDNENQRSDDAGGRIQSGGGRGRVPQSGVQSGTPTSSIRQKARAFSTETDTTQEQSRKVSIKLTDPGPSARKSSMKKSIRKAAPSPPGGSPGGVIREASEERDDKKTTEKKKYSSEESSEEEDTRHLEGNVYTKAGFEISRKSAGNVKRSKQEIDDDPEEEDEFGYTKKKVHKKYHHMHGEVHLVTLEKSRRGLGVSLAGHRDRNKMAVFICGLNPKGTAHKNGELRVGDEILEVNGHVLQGRCHLNASAIIKGIPGTSFKFIVFRKSGGQSDTAVKEVLQFPPMLDDEEIYSQFKGVHVVSVKKGQYGLGIMIIEGKHAEVGQGIFISDIQEGSAAEIAGLLVGDMILAVNMDCLLGSTYDDATRLLKKVEGVVTLTVCNPNQSKVGTIEETKPAEPEKPKEPEKPADPKEAAIIPGRDTTIEFPKDKDKAIGFSVIGGVDTPCGGVFVLDVYPDGAAGKDGRLQPGDRIVEICKESFKTMEQEKAHQAIHKILSGPIVMIVHRDEKGRDEFEVELQKKAGKGSGLCLTAFKSGKGAYISEVVPGGSAAETGKILRGDQVVAVCGLDLREAPVEDIALHIKVSNPVQLKLARYKNTKK